jgi:hypothetical protein
MNFIVDWNGLKRDPNQSALYPALLVTKFHALKRALTYGKLVIVHDGGAGTTLRQSIPLKIDQFWQTAPFSCELSFFKYKEQICRVSDPHNSNADPDPAPHQGDSNLRQLAYRHYRPPL